MKKIFFVLFTFLIVSAAFSQSGKWASINYNYSKGPVSPEYQFNYTISIDSKGNGVLSYTKSSLTNDYNFTAGKKSMKKLNSLLKKSEVLTVPSEEMKGSDNLIGGPSRNMQITMWQAPDLDQKPVTIDVPSPLNEKYSEGVFNVYDYLENMVPKSVWDKATSE